MASPLLGMDIGGTLAKVVVYIPDKQKNSSFAKFFLTKNKETNAVCEDHLDIKTKKGTLHFVKFLSRDVPKFLKHENFVNVQKTFSKSFIFATGGGAFRFSEVIHESNVKLKTFNELDSLVYGLRTILKRNDGCFKLLNSKFGGDVGEQRSKIVTLPTSLNLKKKGVLVVNIGSGVSILHVKRNSYERIGGSSLGGSTFLGLVALLTGCEKFDDALDLAANGDSTRVDMLVKDIYGDKAGVLFKQLRPTTLASSFGKMIHSKARNKVKKEDLALSALIMCSMNVAAIAHIYAKQYGIRNIIFTGNFLSTSEGLRTPNGKKNTESIHMHVREKLSLHKRNTISIRVLSYAVSFWSNEQKEAVFLKYEGCLGALGALLQGSNLQVPKNYEKSKL